MPPRPLRWILRHRRGFLWLGGVVAMCALVRGLLPLALAAGGEHFAGRALGRQVEIDNIDLALHRGGLRIEGVRVGDALPPEGANGERAPIAPDQALLSLGSLHTELSWVSLFRGVAHLRFLELSAPAAHLEHTPDGNLTPIVLATREEPEPEASDDADTEPWPVVVDRFRIRDVLLEMIYEGSSEVEFSLTEFSLDHFGFRDGQVSLGALGIERPEVQVHRELATGKRPIGAPPAAEATPASEPSPSPDAETAPGHHIREIEITRAAFTLMNDDQPLDVVLALSAQEISIDPGVTFPIDVHLEIAGGSLDIQGQLGASPPRFDGTVDWKQIGFPVLSRALGLELPVRTESVRSSGEIEIAALLGSEGEAGQVELSGSVVVEDVSASVIATGERIRVDHLAVDAERFTMPLMSGDAVGSVATFVGEARTSGISFEAPDRALVLTIAETRAAKLDATLPLDPGLPLGLRGAIRVDGIDVRTETGQHIVLGGVDLALARLHLPPGDTGEAIEIDATVGVGALTYTDANQGVSAQVASIDVAEIRTALPASERDALQLRTGAIRIDRPTVEVVRAPSAATEGDPAETVSTPTPTTPGPRARIASLEIQNGSVTVTDQSVEPFARSRLTTISLRAKDIRWPERSVAHFALHSAGPAGATFRADGQLGDTGQIEWSLASLGLPHFNPYAKPVGYRVEEGAFAIEGTVALEGEVIEVDSELLLDQLDLETHRSEEFQDQIGVPVDLALGLLKDPAGRIRLPVRFEAERDEVRAQILPLVLSTLRHAVIGAVTLPLKALKGLIDTDGDGDLRLPVVASAPGSAEVDPAAVEAIEALAQLLAQRPQLGLVVQGQSASADEAPLALAALVDRTLAEAPFPESVETGLFQRRRLRKALREHGVDAAGQLEEEDRAVLESLVAATEVSDAQRTALADARALAVRDALVADHGVSTERLRVAISLDAGAPGSAPELIALRHLERDDTALPAVSTGTTDTP